MRPFLPLLLILAGIPALLPAQAVATFYGQVLDEEKKPIQEVNVVLLGEAGIGTITDEAGRYSMSVPAGKTITVVFTHVSYQEDYKKVFLDPDRYYRYDPVLIERALQEVTIQDDRERQEFIQTIPVESISYIPDPSGDPIVAALKQLGAGSNNELSTQYAVRGGNYDENLVYVNDFEIYRPLIVRSGQQEGFPFPNYTLTDRIAFSAGGFEARYGDKLSSVLDIRYKKPKEFAASVSLSLLGGNFHVEAANAKKTAGFLLGVRHKNNAYLLNSLETTGEYRPSFTDVQGLIHLDLSKKLELEFLGNMSQNRFNFQPQDRSTSTGLVNNVVRLDVFFDGQEVDEFLTSMGGVSLLHKPNKDLGLKWMASTYRALEDENFDIIGDYFLGEVESNLGEEDFGQVAFGLGVGTFQNYARNRIDSWVSNVGHIGYLDRGEHFVEWGGRFQYERIEDRINDWTRLDSAGYSLPYTGEQVLLDRVLKASTVLRSTRTTAYVQDTWTPYESALDWSLTAGVRALYWDMNNEFLVTPRVQAAFKPDWVRRDSVPRDVVIKAAAGLYAQPAYYRELRDLTFDLNTDIKAQKSMHLVLSGDWNFRAFDRDFKFVSEIYYKYLWDIVPYELDNVQVRYYGQNAGTGYVAGIDLRLHGELVEDADSWISVTIMQARENIDESKLTDIFGAVDENGELVDRGLTPRPTDQRINFGMYFQDYALDNKNFKVHLNFLFGSGLPFGQPENLLLRNRFRIPPYRRVDIGFSALLLKQKDERTNMFRHLESVWASLEVFNLLGISNTVSYLWVKDNADVVYAFPNFLTSRLLNARIIVDI
ncbi:MAG: TonB-dependent receptor [Bacteroidetes bacterium]|nr:TonB-dependent receptor [Bacteroidota bacterium]